jgi:dihydroxyacetone kinase-like predicted kinase
MQEQHRAIRAEADRSEPSQVPSGKIATVAVAVGEGFQQLFRSLGVDAIVIGGQSMNPSTYDFVEAIDSLSSDQVIVLVNNRNALLAARHAQSETSKRVELIDTENMAEGIAALFGFDSEGDIEVERDKMTRAARDSRTAAITRAVRDASVDGLAMTKGQYIALENGEPTAAADDLGSIVQVVLSRLGGERAELVTFYWGEDLSQQDEQLILETSSGVANEASVESFRGDQPHYLALISVE